MGKPEEVEEEDQNRCCHADYKRRHPNKKLIQWITESVSEMELTLPIGGF